MLRIIYMGTPYFAVPALQALIKGATPDTVLPDGYEIATVVTRPDKPSGRNQERAFSPVKQTALAAGLSVWQPGSFKKLENSQALANYAADLYIVAAFGQILPQVVLNQPRYGTLNIHASLLPRYRGPNPIAEAILQGESETGISIMQLDAGIDTGPVLARQSLSIAADDTTGTLTGKLAELGAQTLLNVLPSWIAGTLAAEQQDEQYATHTHMLHKEDGKISWQSPAAVIARQVRAYLPWPSAYTFWNGKLLKILAAHALQGEPGTPVPPGTVATREDAGHTVLEVITSSGFLLVSQVQLEGKRAMSAEEFLRGYASIVGQVLS